MTRAEIQQELISHRSRYYKTDVFIPKFGELPQHEPTVGYSAGYGSSGAELHPWLRDHYHPQFILRNTRTRRYSGYIRIFNENDDRIPNKFHDPEILLDDLYDYASIFTYRIIYSTKMCGMIDKMIRTAELGRYNGTRGDFKDDANIKVDQCLISKYKSLANMADILYREICNNLTK